jgi:hypothetical protein
MPDVRNFYRGVSTLTAAPLVLAGVMGSPAQILAQVPATSRDLTYLDFLGQTDRMSLSEVARLESELLRQPDNLSIRARLISHYFHYAILQPRVAHILWVVQHHPGSKLAASPVARVLPDNEVLNTRSDYEQLRAAWLRQIDSHPAQPDVLANAAAFFEFEEPARCEPLLKQSLHLQPDNRFRLAALANFYTRIIAGCDIYGDRCSDRAWLVQVKVELESSTNAELVISVGQQLLTRLRTANTRIVQSDESFPLRLLQRAAELR